MGQLELLCRQRNCLDFNGSFPAAAEADEIVECRFKTIQKGNLYTFNTKSIEVLLVMMELSC